MEPPEVLRPDEEVLARQLPALAHWFHLSPKDVYTMSWSDLAPFRAALRGLPPVGVVVMGGEIDPKVWRNRSS